MQERLKSFASLFDVSGNETGGKEKVFQFDDRNSRLVLSAPHSVRSFACKKIKAADLFTGEIVCFLGENHGISTIVRRQFVPYKVLISDFVAEQGLLEKSFLDFHGMVNDRPFDLAVGTGLLGAAAYKRELEFVRFLAEKYQIRVVFNHPDYRGGAGLCGRLQRDFNSNRVLQLEWRRDFRDFYTCADIVCGQTLPFMAELINFLHRGFPSG